MQVLPIPGRLSCWLLLGYTLVLFGNLSSSLSLQHLMFTGMERLKHYLPLGKRKNGVSSPRVFGVTLDDLIKSQAPHQIAVTETDGGAFKSANVPFIVDRICKYIFANGIEEEGIFRVNGNARVIEKLKECFEKHGDADLESSEDIFAIAGLLKLFLRELPEAVIPEYMTSKFVKCQEVYKQDKTECIRQLKQLLEELPKSHYDLLKYTIRFLVDVAAKDSNKMSPMGLAIVFGPNLFRCSAGIEGLRDQGITNEIVCKFLSEYTTLFGELTEPGPFTIPYIHQNREKRRQAPMRPPPPKLADSNATLSLPLETSEDIRPTTSLSQEFMERASPFTIVDTDGHSSIASPVLSAVASELVTKTISEAVLEHIFSETEVRSIFDHWGECDDTGGSRASTASTAHSSTHQQHRRATPITSIVNSTQEQLHPASPHSGSAVSPNPVAPNPRPRTTPSILEESNLEPHPQPKPRTPKHRAAEAIHSPENHTSAVDPPKPKPRMKSAPARHATLADTSLHYSIDMPPVVQSKPADEVHQLHSEEHAESMVTSTSKTAVDNEFDKISSSVSKLEHFARPKGPVKKVASKQKRFSSLSGDSPNKQPRTAAAAAPVDAVHHNKININVGDVNNNIGDDDAGVHKVSTPVTSSVPKLDLHQLDNNAHVSMQISHSEQTVVVIHEASDDESTPPPVPNSDNLLDVGGGENLLAMTPQGRTMEDLSPEPKTQHIKPAENEQHAAQIKTLSKKINGLKKKVKTFEESFEADHGHKPSTQEKNSKMEIKKALVDLAKSRKELKYLKEQGADNPRVESIEPPVASAERAGSRTESVVDAGTSCEPATMADTLELLLKRLKDKRQEANRADDINTLTRDQVQEEKLAVQKALLHFESIHGRPQTKSEKELMRPLYDRYRQIKKALASAPASKPQQKPVEVPVPEMTHAEADSTEMLITQHPDMNSDQHAVPNGEEEEGGESPADPNKIARETNLQELPIPELKLELDKANNTKKKLRKLLRDFEDEFQKENSRKVQREDRGPMEVKYQEYKQIKAKIKLLEALLSKQES